MLSPYSFHQSSATWYNWKESHSEQFIFCISCSFLHAPNVILSLKIVQHHIYIRNDPAGNIKADKEKSTEKIDGAIATIMGLDRAIRCGNDVSASVYDERGILFI